MSVHVQLQRLAALHGDLVVLQSLDGLHGVLMVGEVHEALHHVGLVHLRAHVHGDDLAVRLEQLLEIVLRPRLGEVGHVAAHPLSRSVRRALLILHHVNLSLTDRVLVQVLQHLRRHGGVAEVDVAVVQGLARLLVEGDLAGEDVTVGGEHVHESLVIEVIRDILDEQITLDVVAGLELRLLDHDSHLLSLQNVEVGAVEGLISYRSETPLTTHHLQSS